MSNSNSLITRDIDREAFLKQFGDDATWRDTMDNALVIARRELKDSFRDWRIMGPIVIMTLIFPFLATIGTNLFYNLFEKYDADTVRITNAFLPLMPMIVGFFPISISLVIALESFVGEKERRSLEPLLATPLTNLELYIGKVISSTVPPLVTSYGGIGVYLLGIGLGNLTQQGERVLAINLAVLAQILVLTTIQAIVMVTGAVVLSSQTTSTRAANLLASAIVLPMSLITIVESLMIINVHQRPVLWYVAVGMVVVVIILIRTGVKIFNREELLGKAVDELNIKHFFKALWYYYLALTPSELAALKATQGFSLKRWYRRAVFAAFRDIRLPLRVMIVVMLVSFISAWLWGAITAPDIEIQNKDTFYQNFAEGISYNRDFERNLAVAFAFSRGIAIFAAISLLSFGLPSAFIPTFLSGFLGYLLGGFSQLDINPLALMLIMLPMAMFLVPALVLGFSASLRAGVSVIAPPENVRVGTIWMQSIADFFKIFWGVSVPLLIVGALVNYWITPLMGDLVVAVF